jgi:hypothetical protein
MFAENEEGGNNPQPIIWSGIIFTQKPKRYYKENSRSNSV